MGCDIGKEENEVWLWSTMGRRTHQMVVFVLGDRSAKMCQRLWEALPGVYQARQRWVVG
jgi:IS1 family transposase